MEITPVDEREMLKLFEKFKSLDKTRAGSLTNLEFLSIDELKFTPFRSRLIDGFPLKRDHEIDGSLL